MSLCKEYKKQLEIINKVLETKKILLNNSKEKDPQLLKEIASLNGGKNSLEFGIQWMEKCHEPGKYQGIDNSRLCKSYEI